MPKSVKPNGRGAKPPAKPKPAKKAAKRKTSKKAAAKPTPKTSVFIRNLHNGAGGVRLDLDVDDRRIYLAPRGQIGDLLQVSDEIRDDPVYQRNLDLLFEELSYEAGVEALRKQNINAQSYRGPNPMDFITNEKGEKYVQKRATIEPSNEEAAITVGRIEESGDGRFQSVSRVAPSEVTGPKEVQVPGSRPVFDPNVMPAGLTTEQAALYLETPPEKRLELLQFFQKEAEQNYRLNVSVAPVEVEE